MVERRWRRGVEVEEWWWRRGEERWRRKELEEECSSQSDGV